MSEGADEHSPPGPVHSSDSCSLSAGHCVRRHWNEPALHPQDGSGTRRRKSRYADYLGSAVACNLDFDRRDDNKIRIRCNACGQRRRGWNTRSDGAPRREASTAAGYRRSRSIWCGLDLRRWCDHTSDLSTLGAGRTDHRNTGRPAVYRSLGRCHLVGSIRGPTVGYRAHWPDVRPIMAIWFLSIAVLGIGGIVKHPAVLWAINPWYGLNYRLKLELPGKFRSLHDQPPAPPNT